MPNEGEWTQEYNLYLDWANWALNAAPAEPGVVEFADTKKWGYDADMVTLDGVVRIERIHDDTDLWDIHQVAAWWGIGLSAVTSMSPARVLLAADNLDPRPCRHPHRQSCTRTWRGQSIPCHRGAASQGSSQRPGCTYGPAIAGTLVKPKASAPRRNQSVAGGQLPSPMAHYHPVPQSSPNAPAEAAMVTTVVGQQDPASRRRPLAHRQTHRRSGRRDPPAIK